MLPLMPCSVPPLRGACVATEEPCPLQPKERLPRGYHDRHPLGPRGNGAHSTNTNNAPKQHRPHGCWLLVPCTAAGPPPVALATSVGNLGMCCALPCPSTSGGSMWAAGQPPPPQWCSSRGSGVCAWAHSPWVTGGSNAATQVGQRLF